MDLNSLLLFIVACLAINMIPGPDVIYIVSNTMKGKLATGFKAAMGLGLLFSVLATMCNVLYASVGSWVFSRPNSQRYSRGLEGVSGVLLIGLASKVAVSDR